MTLILNLLPLFLFKYTDFLIENLNPVLRIAGLTGIKIPDWILPLGISFYSFRLISYQIELYRKKVPVAGNFIHLFLYTAFFPHLGAGPIVRYHEFYHRIYSKKLSLSGFSSGLQRFILGLVKKAVIANNLGIVADSVFNIPGDDLSLSTAWLGVLSYTFQVYYDFSGYSDMAIGLSRMAGFNTPENFNFPYKALSVKDFWKRWHMTLTNWFRDYLFLPVAYYFSRKLPGTSYWGIKSESFIYCISIIITWALVGLWHGASWTFVVWGLTFGFFLMLEQLGLGRLLRKTKRPLRHLYTMTIVILAWIFFRADSFSQGFAFLRGMTGIQGMITSKYEYYRYFTHSFLLIFVIAVAGATGILNQFRVYCWKIALIKKYSGKEYYPVVYQAMVYFLLLITFGLAISEILINDYTPFIYFKF